MPHDDTAAPDTAAPNTAAPDTAAPNTAANDAAIVTATLDQVAQRVGDPTPHVFKRLFQDMPETEELFIRDREGLIRGQMFQVTMDSLLDFLGDRFYGATLVQIERINHEGLGVETDVFDRFYWTVKAAFRDLLADDWTPEMEAAWTRVLTQLTARDG